MCLLLHELGVDKTAVVLHGDDPVDRNLAERHVHRDVGKGAARSDGVGVDVGRGIGAQLVVGVHVVVGLKGERGKRAYLAAGGVPDSVVAQVEVLTGGGV